MSHYQDLIETVDNTSVYDDASSVNSSIYYSHTDYSESNNSKLKKYKNYEKNNVDKRYRFVKRPSSNNSNILRKYGVYVTNNTPGFMISHAITGNYVSNARVGSKYEDYFFKVKVATGEFGSNSGNLFFDTPEQYEKYFKTNLSAKTKQLWADKYKLFCINNKDILSE